MVRARRRGNTVTLSGMDDVGLGKLRICKINPDSGRMECVGVSQHVLPNKQDSARDQALNWKKDKERAKRMGLIINAKGTRIRRSPFNYVSTAKALTSLSHSNPDRFDKIVSGLSRESVKNLSVASDVACNGYKRKDGKQISGDQTLCDVLTGRVKPEQLIYSGYADQKEARSTARKNRYSNGGKERAKEYKKRYPYSTKEERRAQAIKANEARAKRRAAWATGKPARDAAPMPRTPRVPKAKYPGADY